MQFDAQVYGNLPFRWAVCSDTGRVRQVNEDAHLVEPETGLFVVSDGMGGHPGGEVASDFVAENLSVRIETGLHKMRPQSPRAVRNLLKKAVGFHSRELYHEGRGAKRIRPRRHGGHGGAVSAAGRPLLRRQRRRQPPVPASQ
ncbi:MAG: PP2C family protein-serine/threonine phosphatase [Planctomycetota bacterium]